MLNKPLIPSPYNECVPTSDGEIEFCCELPNRQTADNGYVGLYNANNGEVIFEEYVQNDSSPLSEINYTLTNVTDEFVGEYCWKTFYWNVPQSAPISYTVLESAIKDSSKLMLLPDMEVDSNTTTLIKTNNEFGAVWDTYESLANYVGYPAIVYAKSVETYIKNIGVENCVLLFYDVRDKDNEILLGGTNVIDVCRDVVIIDNDSLHSNFSDNKVNTSDGYTNIRTDFCIKSYMTDISEQCLIEYNGDYYNVLSYDMGYGLETTIYPRLRSSIENSNTVNVYFDAEFNTSPDYYFRAKKAPTISLVSDNDLTWDAGTGIIKSFNINVGIEFSDYSTPLNSFQLFLADSNGDVIASSPLLLDATGMYEFKGIGCRSGMYRLHAVCIDNDGDEWTGEDITLTVPADTSSLKEDVSPIFNSCNNTISIDISWINDSNFDFYRYDGRAKIAEYAGGGYRPKDDMKSKFIDYNIRSEESYTYYIDVDGTLYHFEPVKVSFENTSIIGLTKRSNIEYEITDIFNISYYLDKSMGDLTQDMTREYVGAFSQYPKVLKGYQSSLSGTVKGLLGVERDNDSKHLVSVNIRKEWLDFVTSDSLKLYRGMDGETMFISINANKIIPHHFNSSGLVNEVEMSFKQVGSANNAAIYIIE